MSQVQALAVERKVRLGHRDQVAALRRPTPIPSGDSADVIDVGGGDDEIGLEVTAVALPGQVLLVGPGPWEREVQDLYPWDQLLEHIAVPESVAHTVASRERVAVQQDPKRARSPLDGDLLVATKTFGIRCDEIAA
jgi:hypothetical protein